jgi:methionyl-tRNA formyltransferase
VLGRSTRGIAVATGAGVLHLGELQLPGRKRVAAVEFAHAHALDGVVLGR